ncbi:MAG: sugar kinase, partial [bacterium]|nr:sugar kinase [bacterium]
YDSVITPFGEVEDALGGSAVHFSAASSLFTETKIVGVVGEDYKMEELDFLKKRGTDLSGISVEKGKTFRWKGRYHKNMNIRDTLSTELNVFASFEPEIPDSLRSSEYLFLANIHPELQLKVLEQVEKPKLTALDTMNFWIDDFRSSLEKVLAKVDIVVMNDSEVMDFTGEQNLVTAAKRITERGPRIVIIKKGEHGSILFHENEFFILPAYLIETVIDPTGAGDSFAGGFMGYIAKKDKIDSKTLKRAMAYGTCTASFLCEAFGMRALKNLSMDDLEERLKSFKQQFLLP